MVDAVWLPVVHDAVVDLVAVDCVAFGLDLHGAVDCDHFFPLYYLICAQSKYLSFVRRGLVLNFVVGRLVSVHAAGVVGEEFLRVGWSVAQNCLPQLPESRV